MSEPPAAAEDGGRQGVPGSPPEPVVIEIDTSDMPVVTLEETAAERLGPDGAVSSSSIRAGLEPEEEAAESVGELAVTGSADVLLRGDPVRTAPSSAPTTRRYVKWTRDLLIERLQEIAGELGHTPTVAELRKRKESSLASDKTINPRGFATYADLVKAARLEPPAKVSYIRPGLERPGRGGSTTTRDLGRTKSWTRETIIEAIQRWHREHDGPPASNAWTKRNAGYPSSSTVAKHFGSWSNAIEAAGFPRPVRGGLTVQPQQASKWIKVNGTGLAYRSSAEAYVAAEEIEADGERVAEAARFDGNEAKAEQARDASLELADKIRAAARAADERASGSSTSSEVEREEPALREGEPARTESAQPRARSTGRKAAETVADSPSRGVELEQRDPTPSASSSPLMRLLAKLPTADLNEAVLEIQSELRGLHVQLAIVEEALDVKDAA